MKSLLTVRMTEAQVKDACRAFAQLHTAVIEPCNLVVTLSNGSGGVSAEVSFVRKRERERKAKA